MKKIKVKKQIEKWESNEIVLIICDKILSGLENAERLYLREDVLASSTLYMAYRKAKIPKTLSDVAILTDIEEKYIGRGFRKIKKALGTHLCKDATLMGTKCIVPQNIPNLIREYGNKLNLTNELIDYAIKLYEKTKDNVGGRSPKIITCAVLYISCNQNNHAITQREVGDMCNTTEVGLRKNVQLIAKLLDLKIFKGFNKCPHCKRMGIHPNNPSKSKYCKYCKQEKRGWDH